MVLSIRRSLGVLDEVVVIGLGIGGVGNYHVRSR